VKTLFNKSNLSSTILMQVCQIFMWIFHK